MGILVLRSRTAHESIGPGPDKCDETAVTNETCEVHPGGVNTV